MFLTIYLHSYPENEKSQVKKTRKRCKGVFPHKL